MKVTLFITLLLISNSLKPQSNTDYQRMTKACELWGLIKYLHPDNPGSAFDSAFCASVPEMMTAKNDNDWNNLLSKFLAVLDDGETKTVWTDTASPEPTSLKAEFTKDSILIVQIAGSSLFDDYLIMEEFFQGVKEKITKANRGIIFDLRQKNKPPGAYEGYLESYFTDVNDILSTQIVPQYRSKYHSGFKSDAIGPAGDYKTNEVLTPGLEPGSFEKQGKMVVWIINANSELPVVALSEQASGVGIILSNSEGIGETLPLFHTFNLSENLGVRFKTAALYFPNSFQPSVDYLYSKGEDPLKIAEEYISGKSLPRNKVAQPTKPYRISNTSYPEESFPALGYRVLAAAKIFTVIELFFPYYQYMDRDWKDVLKESLPEFVSASNEMEYSRAVAKMYANISDFHGYIIGNKAQSELQGEAPPPILADLIEGKVVITKFRNDSVCRANKLSVGDIITKVDGVPVDTLMKKYEQYFAHSTNGLMKQMAAWYSLRGGEGESGTFTVEDKNGKQADLKLKWTNMYYRTFTPEYKLDTITLLNEKIGYADLTRMTVSQTAEMFEKFRNTKAIIFDMRGYPNGTARSIAPRLTDKKNVPVALFRKREVLVPPIKNGMILSTKSYTEFIQTIDPSDKWKYRGKTVMLINHMAASQAEHTGLLFESVNNTIFIGSPTAGANGDVTRFQIPGGMILTFSGQGVWHADGTQLQRVGLQPKVLVTPTIAGIRAGKDEVLDKAVEWITKNVRSN